MKRAAFVGRFQPYHLGHDNETRRMDNAGDIDEIVICIGSSQHSHMPDNPFTAEERKEMLLRSLNIRKPYHIIEIPDIDDYPRWVGHLESLCPEFSVVYSGNTITKKLFSEKGYNVRDANLNYKISATDIRRLIAKNGNWHIYVPEGTRNVILEVGGVERIKELHKNLDRYATMKTVD